MATKEAIIKQVKGITLLAKSDSNHWVVMDGSDKFGGSLAGSGPKELLMFALGGCTAMDVIPILAKRKAPVENVEVKISGNVREEHPQVFTELHVEYVLYGNGINKEDVERAIELSTTKYCAVSAMLKPGVKITHSYRIESTTAPAV
ncbi:MAG: OsmC family protein [Ignavibacteriales bacterium]|nr:OsmC family protein [Ignavibacteriales bacterium]